MTSTRAQEVAEILWELKRADKIAKYSIVAKRAGFSAGSKGRAMETALRAVRRDWPHLQWWRTVNDDGVVEKDSEQAVSFLEAGFELEDADGHENGVTIKGIDELLMVWENNEEPAAEEPAAE